MYYFTVVLESKKFYVMTPLDFTIANHLNITIKKAGLTLIIERRATLANNR